MFYAPASITILGHHTNYTGGKILSAGSQLGVWLYVELVDSNEIYIEHDNLKQSNTFSRATLKSRFGTWIDFPLEIISTFLSLNMPYRGMRFSFFNNLPETIQGESLLGLLTAYALNEIFQLKMEKPELSRRVQDAAGKLQQHQTCVAAPYAMALATPGNILKLDCHSYMHESVLFDQEKYAWVAIDSGISVANYKQVIAQRMEELQSAKEQINQYFELPYLGALEGADYDWLDKLLEDELTKRRLRHVVNENTRVDWAFELLEDNKMNELGRLMFDAHESLALDFEVSCPELDLLVKLAKESEGIVGACMMTQDFAGYILNLVEKNAVKSFTDQILKAYQKQSGIQAFAYPLTLSGKLIQLTKSID